MSGAKVPDFDAYGLFRAAPVSYTHLLPGISWTGRYFYAINSENCVLAEETVQTEKIDSGKYQLADQNPPQISLHTDHGNGKKYEQEPDQKTDHVGDKDPSRHTETLQNAGERGIQIQKRTDESQRHDEMPGQFTVEQFGSHPIPQKKKNINTPAAHGNISAIFLSQIQSVPWRLVRSQVQ